MKLAYIYIGSVSESSVNNKVIAQIEAFNFNGVETKGFIFNDEVDKITNYSNDIQIIPIKNNVEKKKKYFQKYYNNQYVNTQVSNFLETIYNSYDYLFIRDFSVGISKIKLLKRYRSKILLYIPSNTLRENYLEKKHWGKLGPRSFIIHWVDYFLYFYIWEWINLKFIYSKLKRVVVFTPEFGKILNKKSLNKVNFIYNRDGVSCNKVKVRNIHTTNSNVVKLIFLKGSSTQQVWSGLDRLIKSINDQDKYQFELYITGFIQKSEDYQYPFVKLVGRLERDELNELIDNVDIGVSNLANYLIEFNETTNLKTREYYACGLPFFQSNSMPDIDESDAEKYYLKVPNDNSNIDMKLVYDFAMRMREDIEHPKKMRSFAENNLDWKITCGQLDFNSLLLEK